MRKKSGFTLVEILTVLAIIGLLVGMLIPAVSAVRSAARDVKQAAQFTTIELALTAFKNDYGDYPESFYGHRTLVMGIYCGSQKLSEALLGWDLLGFHPNSDWRWDGLDAAGGPLTYNPPDPTVTLDERKKPYIEAGTGYAFTLTDLYPTHALAGSAGTYSYVLCDTFGKTKVTLPDGSTVNAGSPILYYSADSSGRFNDPTRASTMTNLNNQNNVYNYLDNNTLIQIKEAVEDPAGTRPAFDAAAFYPYIEDPKITALPSPYNPTSYILISAGADGIYGTDDDIRNFGD